MVACHLFLLTVTNNWRPTSDFITLGDPSYHEGVAKLSSGGKLELMLNQSRFMGCGSHLNSKLYLLSDKWQSLKYPDFVPFYKLLHLQDWRALQYRDWLYLLSGYKSGTVFYFKPTPLSKFDANTTLELQMGTMNYSTFFGCSREARPLPTFPPEDVVPKFIGIEGSHFCKLFASFIINLS